MYVNSLSFDDVLLVPGYFDGTSRKDIDISTNISGLKLDFPVVCANMPSVATADMAYAFSLRGGLVILDRMNQQPIESQIKTIKSVKKVNSRYIGASIGLSSSAIEDAALLISSGADLICVDVAHGNQKRMFDLYDEFRNKWKKFPLILGNFAMPPGYSPVFKDEYLTLKVGVGGGSMCTTRIQTGCGMPTLQSVLEFCIMPRECGVMADGGIKNSGDIVKSLAAGANSVMVGSLVAGTDESSGPVLKDGKTGDRYKVYRGNASYGAKQEAGMMAEYIEGTEMLVKYKGAVSKVLNQLEQGIKSGFSYVGAYNIKELQKKSKFTKITSAGMRESLPHGIL